MSQATVQKLLYEQKQLPVFQNRMYDTHREAVDCPKGDVALVEDQRTGLVYNASFRPEMMIYDAQYQNEQALSPLFKVHLQSVAELIENSMGRASIVEVGCGKGFFLEMLLARGVDVIGFDPTYEGDNPRVVKRYFEPSIGIKAKGLVLRHVLEHIQDPFQFLLQLKAANGGNGKIYIEVPCFDWICEHRAWSDIFYEHVNYFRMSDFHRMFGTVVECKRLFGNQYLGIVGELATLKPPIRDASDGVVFPENFMQSLYDSGPPERSSVALWGGASKGVIFALLKARSGQMVGPVIDINPAKQGRYLPATGLLVQSPAMALSMLPAGSRIYVMNSNYLDEIKQMSGALFEYVTIDGE